METGAIEVTFVAGFGFNSATALAAVETARSLIQLFGLSVLQFGHGVSGRGNASRRNRGWATDLAAVLRAVAAATPAAAHSQAGPPTHRVAAHALAACERRPLRQSITTTELSKSYVRRGIAAGVQRLAARTLGGLTRRPMHPAKTDANRNNDLFRPPPSVQRWGECRGATDRTVRGTRRPATEPVGGETRSPPTLDRFTRDVRIIITQVHIRCMSVAVGFAGRTGRRSAIASVTHRARRPGGTGPGRNDTRTPNTAGRTPVRRTSRYREIA